MASLREPPSPGELEALLRQGDELVRYDVARGLERHRRLIAAQTPLPEWAESDRVQPRSGPAGRRRMGWTLWTLSLGFVMFLALTRKPEVVGLPRGQDLSSTPVHATHAISARSSGRSPEPLAAERKAAHAPGTRSPTPSLPLPEQRETLEPVHALDAAMEQTVLAPSGSSDKNEEPKSAPELSANEAELMPARKNARRQGFDTLTGRRTNGKARAQAESPRDAEEMRALTQAELLLLSEPLQTLKLVRAGELAFQHGYFTQERRYLEVMALFALGRREEAHGKAAWFLRDYGAGPYRQKVELAILRYPVP